MVPVLERYIRAMISCDAILHNLNNLDVSISGVTDDKNIRRQIKEIKIELDVLKDLIRKKLYRIRSKIDAVLDEDFMSKRIDDLLGK